MKVVTGYPLNPIVNGTPLFESPPSTSQPLPEAVSEALQSTIEETPELLEVESPEPETVPEPSITSDSGWDSDSAWDSDAEWDIPTEWLQSDPYWRPSTPEPTAYNWILREQVTQAEADQAYLRLRKELYIPYPIGTLVDECVCSLAQQQLDYLEDGLSWSPLDYLGSVYFDWVDYMSEFQSAAQRGKLRLFDN